MSRPNEEESFNLYIQALQHFILMKEKGFPLEEGTECLFLICSSHLSMGREFHLYKELIEDGVGDPYSILGFYEMLLWINCEFEDKIRDLCSFINVDAEDKGRGQAEIYLLAFCEKDRKKDILKMLKMVDITKMPSGESVACVFRSLGRLFLVNQLEELIMLLRASESATVDTSYLIFEFVSNIPGLKVEKVISKFNNLHKEFNLQPSVAAYENLITYCCNLLKVREAFAVVECMCESGLTLSADTFIPILCAIEKMKMGDVDLTMDMLVKDINLNDPKSALDKFAAVNILQASLDDEEEVWEETDQKDLNK